MKHIYYYLLMAAILCMVYIKSGAQNLATAQDMKIIHIAIDTPKLKTYGGIAFFNEPAIDYSVRYGYLGFCVTDSTGTVATRDTCGNWVIKDAARSLEVMYQFFIKQREFRLSLSHDRNNKPNSQ